MKTDRTNKEVLYKGLNKMGLSLIFMFIGPTLLHIAFTNKEKSFYYIILLLGFIVCFLAIFFGFKGILTILDSMFKKK